MRRSAHARAVAQLVAAALLWSLGGLLIKAIAWTPMAVAGGRGLIAALFLLAVSPRFSLRFSRLEVLGAVAYAACTFTFVAATKATTAANAILLQYTAPVWVALLGSWFLGERATRTDWAAIGVVFVGFALFFADSLEMGHIAGNALAASSGICFAAIALLMRKQKDGTPIKSIILGNVMAFAAGAPWIFRAPALAPGGWAALALLGLAQLGCSYWLYARAIRHVTAMEAVLIPVVEPILNPIWVLLAIGERPGPLAIAGGALVLGAATFRAFKSIRGGAAGLPSPA
jgi:drug/metabolite transporter (DMT)-like permease